jgi:hypothetical protein
MLLSGWTRAVLILTFRFLDVSAVVTGEANGHKITLYFDADMKLKRDHSDVNMLQPSKNRLCTNNTKVHG